jgi:hypothetical protein
VDSDLAEDDAGTPMTSAVAVYQIVMALDHLGSVVDALETTLETDRPMRHYAHSTTLRTALESSARVRWSLMSDSSAERQLRGLRVRYENLLEQRKAMNGLAGKHIRGEREQARKQIIAATDADIKVVTDRASALGANTLDGKFDTVSMLRGMVKANSFEGTAILQLWRTGSATAHGYFWADQLRDNPGQFDHVWFHSALYGATMFVNDAMKLYHQWATTNG